MPSMGAGDVVIYPQLGANASRHCLFPYIDMNEPRHSSGAEDLARLEFKLSNQHHVAIEQSTRFRSGGIA